MTRPSEASDTFSRQVLNALSAHVAILDTSGQILETNRAWKRFARDNQLKMRPDTLGVNYLSVCRSALARDSGSAALVYQGIQDLIAGISKEFIMEYPCHSPDEERWFYMRATRMVRDGQTLLVVSHENITPLKKARDELKRQKTALKAREKELEVQARHLAETNTALKVILDRREKDRAEQKRLVISGIQEQVYPCLGQLAASNLDERQAAWVQVIRSCLDGVISPLAKSLAALDLRLTPKELQTALLIREGNTTKEIARIQGCSVDAVEFHRKNIRKKLGLTHGRANLQAFLKGLD